MIQVAMEFTRTMKAELAGPQGAARLSGLVSPLTTPDLFNIRMTSVRAAHIVVAYAAATPCRIDKAKPYRGQFQMILPLDSPIHVEEQRPHTIQPGGMIAATTASRPPLRLETSGRAMIVSILGRTARSDFFMPPNPHYIASASSPSLAVMRSAADTLFRSEDPDANVIGLISRIYSMILADAYIESAAEKSETLLVAQAHKVIVDQFARQDCTPQAVADELEVSLRSLQRAFANEAGVANTIKAYRTQEAMKLLQSPRRDLSVEGIAHRSGFKDSRSMRKAVLAHIGVLPSTYRKHFS